MIAYRKLPETNNIFMDWIVSWYNLILMRKVVISIAWNLYKKTGRETHIAEMFGSYVIFDSRERQDLNKSGKVNKLNILEARRASIWNSTAYKHKLTKSL